MTIVSTIKKVSAGAGGSGFCAYPLNQEQKIKRYFGHRGVRIPSDPPYIIPHYF